MEAVGLHVEFKGVLVVAYVVKIGPDVIGYIGLFYFFSDLMEELFRLYAVLHGFLVFRLPDAAGTDGAQGIGPAFGVADAVRQFQGLFGQLNGFFGVFAVLGPRSFIQAVNFSLLRRGRRRRSTWGSLF